jgi:hypothetical protein
MAVGVCYAKPWDRAPRWRFTLKPAAKDGTVGRYLRSLLVVPSLSTAAVFSSKIRLNIFRLQFVLSYNWARQSPNLEYRWAGWGMEAWRQRAQGWGGWGMEAWRQQRRAAAGRRLTLRAGPAVRRAAG